MTTVSPIELIAHLRLMAETADLSIFDLNKNAIFFFLLYCAIHHLTFLEVSKGHLYRPRA
jgi:hypothetical protein